MPQFCQDRDLLSIEPLAYLSGAWQHQALATGNAGTQLGTTFTDTGADFVSNALAPGMVLVTWTTIPAEGLAWEIVSVDSATQLQVSVLRSSVDGPAIAPPAGTDLSWQVLSYASQIGDVSAALAEMLRHACEASPIAQADFVDSAQLRLCCATGVLERIFSARAENARPYDACWIKAEYFRTAWQQARAQLRLAVDLDGDGQAEETRSLGHCRLRRI